MWIAITHIIGAVLASCLLIMASLIIGVWIKKRVIVAELQAISIQLGVAVEDLEDHANVDRALLFMADRYSNDRLSNRLSDLFGLLQTALDWLVFIVQIGILVGVIWSAATGSVGEASNAWSIPAISLLLWIERMLLMAACRVLTGRYPSQAKECRKKLSELLRAKKQQSAHVYT
ncbi:hypothetical protein [Pseudomonas sp. NFPP07]|uniref:hypothetical protein n=1 Tax=Pseudomonas sp. NFPP07 TaxID=1566213 RepID=UPI000B86B750|nr:hypothetical protein [Pseudomonas sp. NFPP07]